MNSRSLIALAAILTAPGAFGMKYKATTPILIQQPPIQVFGAKDSSTCSTASNTIAVGIEQLPNAGFRLLCADAGILGFWTAVTPASTAGLNFTGGIRLLCPSGSALSGISTAAEITATFLPVCSTLVPSLRDGIVTRSGLFSVGESSVAANSDLNACGANRFVQTLRATLTNGSPTSASPLCNEVETIILPIENFDGDLTLRTTGQKATLGRNGSETFNVEVYNLGIASLNAADVTVELRFNSFAWRITPISNIACTDLQQRKGFDMIVVGKRCTVPGSLIAGRGGRASFTVRLDPAGPDILRPAAPPASVVSAKVVLNANAGDDPVDTNDLAAFPVEIR